MSLLDQLSFLCAQPSAPNYQPSFFSFSLDNQCHPASVVTLDPLILKEIT